MFPQKETKNIIEQIIVKLFDGTAKKMQKISLFVRLGILGKTINLTSKGGRTEDVKLFCIDFNEILTNDFEESMFKSYFSDYQFLYMVFGLFFIYSSALTTIISCPRRHQVQAEKAN